MTGNILTREDILGLLRRRPPLVEGIIDPATQVGPDGVDLTVKTVESFKVHGVIDFDNSSRLLPETDPLKFDQDDSILLSCGAYKITYNEVINVPRDLIAFGFPRSSLLRCGASTKSAVWDSGYRGRSVSLLSVYNPKGLEMKRNARVTQLIFFKTTGPVKEPYNGMYQKENI